MPETIKLLALSSSPRRNGNTGTLLAHAVAAAESAGAQTTHIHLPDLKITPCIECNHCYKDGDCSITDDFQSVRTAMIQADRIIFASPVFFMSITAQAKLLIDRCQCLWVRKFHLKRPVIADSPVARLAAVIAVGGSRSNNMFDSIRWTMQTYLDTLDFHYAAGLYVNRIDAIGDIDNHHDAIQQAKSLGESLANPNLTPPESPKNTILP